MFRAGRFRSADRRLPTPGVGNIAVEACADYVKEQEYVSVDDEKLLKLGVLRPKKSISDLCSRSGVKQGTTE